MPQDNATYRSFAALRMTNDAIPVILSAAKDLYESSRDYILQIPQLSVKNLKKAISNRELLFHACIISLPKHSGRWKSGAGASTGLQTPKWGCRLSSHL